MTITGINYGCDPRVSVYARQQASFSGTNQTPAMSTVQPPQPHDQRETSESQHSQSRQARDGGNLGGDEKKEVEELQRRDREVRAHEQAHMAAGAGLVRGVSFRYEVGPDGHLYVVGGEVSIDTSKGRTPEETVIKMQRVKAAALAPAQPSGQDRTVAAQADAVSAQARAEILKETQQDAPASPSPSPGTQNSSSHRDGENSLARKAYSGVREGLSSITGTFIDLAA